MKYLLGALAILIAISSNVAAQDYTVKYNELLKQYEIRGEYGQREGTIKYNDP